MLTLPDAIVAVLIPFAPLFHCRTWQKAQVLLVGAILAPGRRTVAATLRVMGLSDDRNYARYHHVLNRAAWSSLAMSRVLLNLLLQHLDQGEGPLISVLTRPWSDGRVHGLALWESIGTQCGPTGTIRSRPAACAGYP